MTHCASCSRALPPASAYCSYCGVPTPTLAFTDSGTDRAATDEQLEERYFRMLADFLAPRYDLRRLVGQGGFAAVYEAWDRNLDRQVAVKAVRPMLLAWPQFRERFRREARLLAQLRHPNIVEVYDFGERHDVAYMVMPFLGSETLEHRLQVGTSLPADDAIPIMRDVAAGLQAAHDQGVVHRDVKPSNIMWDGATARWRVMDFGIAKVAYSGLMAATGTATALGTPWYMAPEQAEDAAGADRRADIYSFGATFYHVLTGRLPFDGDSPLSVLIRAKIDPLPSPRSVNKDIPDFLNDCIERCLAKEPADRLQSFSDVLSVLDRSAGASAWELSSDPVSASSLRRYQERRAFYLDRTGPGLAEPDVYQLPNGRQLSIWHGDITDQQVNAIVSSDDNVLSMGGGVSGRIHMVGGEEVWVDARHLVPVRPGRVVVTRAGKLKALFVLHGVTLGLAPKYWGSGLRVGVTVEPSRDLISEIIDGCFYHAETLELQSLAFPLLGTGAGGFAPDVCLDTMFRVLLRRLLFGVTSVRDVRIVLFRP